MSQRVLKMPTEIMVKNMSFVCLCLFFRVLHVDIRYHFEGKYP